MQTLCSFNASLTKSFGTNIHHPLSLRNPTKTLSLTRHPAPSLRCRRSLAIQCMYSAQPSDNDSKLAAKSDSSPKLKIAIVGFGNYGQFLARMFVRQGHIVLAYSRSDHSEAARAVGVKFFNDPDDLCEQHPEVILISTAIIATERVVKSFPWQRLKRNTMVVDVLSVKEFTKNLFLEVLPADADILCTHPMFGPQSAKDGWEGLNFVYDKVRIGNEESRVSRCERFLEIFQSEGCKMVEMSCVDHDVYAAGSQFITHTVGRVLDMLRLQSTPINTKGYETLLDLVENTAADSFDLYYGLFVYNKSALEMLHRLDVAFDALKQQLVGRLHEVVRKQLFNGGAKNKLFPVNGALTKQSLNGAANGLTMHSFNGSLNGSLNGSAFLPSSKLSWYQDAAGQFNSNGHISYVDDGSKLKIAIIGFGNFGQFMAKTMVKQGHTVLGYSRSDYSEVAKDMGVSFFNDIDDLCEEHPDVIFLGTAILATGKVLKSLPLQRLKRSTLFVDVLSVKEFPRKLFLQKLPPDFDILCTHPMFGPESGKNGWNGLPFVFDKVRVGSDPSRVSRCNQFLNIFAQEGCTMVEMSCAEHDRYAAGSQFLTHTIGRMLEKFKLELTPVNTKGYQTLLKLVENTAGDSFDLYYGLFLYNANAMEQLERLDMAFESLKDQLFERLHDVLHDQVFEDTDKFHNPQERFALPKMPALESPQSARDRLQVALSKS